MTDYRVVPVERLRSVLQELALQETSGELGQLAEDADFEWAYDKMVMQSRGALALLGEMLSAAPQDNWLDIESAPRDGTEVLLYVFVAEGSALNDMGLCYWRNDSFFQGWTCGWETGFINPAHWQPLPKPPQIIPGTTEALEQLRIRK